MEKEKEHTRNADKLASLRTDMPMVKIDKEYVFKGPDGSVTLEELFEGRKQLIVYHFMFGPGEDATPCHGCSFHMDQMPTHLGVLHQRNTSYVVVSRAPYEKIAAWQKRLGWPQR